MSNTSLRNSFFFLFASLFPLSAFAQVIVTEIMYDKNGADTGHEWIEIQNSALDPVDIKNWKLAEGGTNHKLTPVGASVISGGAYAIIVQDTKLFQADFPAFSGIIFDSTFSLGNTGDTFSLVNASGTPVSSATFASGMGASGDGNTLNFLNGSWVPRAPSPGASLSGRAIALPAKSAPTAKIPKSSGNSTHSSAVSTKTGSKARQGENAALAAPASADAPNTSSSVLPWILGLSALIMVGAGALFFMPNAKKSDRAAVADEYEIIEDKS